MADGSVNIDTRLETGNIRRDVQTVNSELNRIGENIPAVAGNMADATSAQFDSMGRRIRYAYRGTSEEARRMYSEMASAHRQQSIAMRGMKDQMIGVQYQYFKLAQSSQTYTGTTAQFMSQVRQLGAEQKRINDSLINSNRLAMISMLQTVGTMMNMTTQAQRISDNYTRMANPLYGINRAGLAAANSLNQLANRGNAAVLALKMLGPTASMKDLLNMQMMITQGLMRFQMVALMAAASSVLLYGSLHKANMEMNPKYASAYNNMIEKLTKALQPMRDAFAAIMIPIYNFVAAIADLVIKFNEAHPMLAKIIQGTIMLIPLLTLILSPLAIGIGLWNGMLAAWNSIWMLISPLVTGLAAMSATVWIVAAAVVGLVAGIIYLWNTSEGFRNAIITGWQAIQAAAITVWNFILNGVLIPAWNAIVAFGQQLFGQLTAFWNENSTQIMTIAQVVWSFVKEFVVTTVTTLVAAVQIAFQVLYNVVVSVWEAIKSIISGVVNVILGIIKVFISVLTGDWKGAWEGIKQIVSGAWEAMKGTMRLGVDAVLGIVKGLGTAFGGIFKSIGDTFYNAGKGFMDMLIKGLDSMVGSVTSTISGIAGKIRDFLPFSPAKTGPLSDLDHLDFGGPISDSINLAFPKVKGLLGDMLTLPDIEAQGSYGNYGSSSSSSVTNNTPISITLNYSGDASRNDVVSMVDVIEKELSSRLGITSFMMGVKS
ncbi:phage tail protein [Bacillus sp. BP-3]|uniref:phage tail protein n=1 Tax=Bacillus sp. BP-3 TaxID=3022773 RepID=UPI00232B5FB6|nr:hypothetical protein [Bacillus sp. BP-3]MDC2867559.1 hypothetical protein [Bacillus sp. BP-3]